MKTRNRIAILFCLAIAIPAALAAQELSTTVTVVVLDPTGAPIPHAQIRVVHVADIATQIEEAGGDGELSLAIKRGHYSAFVARVGFRSIEQQFDVTGTAHTQTIRVTLNPGTGSGPTVMESKPDAKQEIYLRFSLDPLAGERRLSLSDLRVLSHKTLSYHNDHTKSDETYSGVPLSDLLAKYAVPLGKDLRGKALSLYVVAVGSDNYKAVLSLAEIDPAFHPGEVIVADSMNGKPLDAASGPFKLVVTEDKRPARCVHNLVSLELRSAD